MAAIIQSGRFSSGSLLGIIQARSLSSGLVLCLDAADLQSYPGSGQSWLDRSGGGYDFFLGSSVSVGGDDPTFNGSAGGGSANEFFSFDGQNQFVYDTAVETWMSNLHKDNATFSFICAAYLAAANDVIYPFATASGAALSGVEVTASGNAGVNFGIDVRNATGAARTILSTTQLNDSAGWNFLGCSLDEAADSCIVKVNGTTESAVACSYTVPSALDASVPKIGTTRGTLAQSADSRIAFLAIWSSAVGSTALNNLYSDIAAARAYGF